MRRLLLVLTACHSSPHASPDAASDRDAAAACAPGLAGAPCVLALYDRAAGCDPTDVAALRTELDARAGLGPLWADGRALFRTQAPANIAGSWNGWSATALATAPLCATDLFLATDQIATGFYTYKLVTAGTWSLDPTNPAFAYDDFAGNPDHRNSVLDTPDSPRGHLVNLAPACSTTLGNCRNVTAYLPAGYDSPAAAARTYPVLFMHDGQNVWDDNTCCFGNGGWQVNLELDSDPLVAPVIVIAADNTVNRNNEYGLDPATTAAFLEFQVSELQPHALTEVRGDGDRVYVAGSSLGGLISIELGLAHPDVYAGAASLSGAFWVGQDTHTALRDQIPTWGKQPVAIYLDSGGDPADNSDSAQDTIDVRDLLVGLGWQLSCESGPASVCYAFAAGAQHDEQAWRARTWRFLRFLFPTGSG